MHSGMKSKNNEKIGINEFPKKKVIKNTVENAFVKIYVCVCVCVCVFQCFSFGGEYTFVYSNFKISLIYI